MAVALQYDPRSSLSVFALLLTVCLGAQRRRCLLRVETLLRLEMMSRNDDLVCGQ